MPTALRLRTATLPDEADALGRADWRAFREGVADGWIAYYRDNSHLRHADGVLVVERGGQIIGQAALLRFDMALAGVDVPVMGIAAVAVAPEARRQGVADLLMREALRRIRKAKVPIALLHPFAMQYYRRFGYELCEVPDLLRVAPAQLPPSPRRRHVRAFDVTRDAAAVEKLYESLRARKDAAGLFRRSRYWWDSRVWKRAGEWHVYVDPRSKQIEGVLGYDVPVEPRYPYQHVLVRELFASTPAAHQGLIGMLAALGEQVTMIEHFAPRGQGVPLVLEHSAIGDPAARAHIAGHLCTGAMGRLVDIGAAFAAHPGPARAGVRGALGLDVEDPVFRDQSRGFDVAFGVRGARVTPGRDARERLTLGVDRLAQIYFGAASAASLLATGVIDGSARAAALLDRAFAGPPLYLGVGNYF